VFQPLYLAIIQQQFQIKEEEEEKTMEKKERRKI